MNFLQKHPRPSHHAMSPTTDIFIKSYPSDFAWLAYSLKSIRKFCTGFQDVVIVVPRGTAKDVPVTGSEKVFEVDEVGDGYMFQQAMKLRADEFCTAENICFFDSDAVFTAVACPKSFMVGGKLAWMMTPREKIGDDNAKCWFPVMERELGIAPEFEFMRRHPFVVPRDIISQCRNFLQSKHGMGIVQYVAGLKNRDFTEFNILGFFSWLHYRERFHWINTETGDVWPRLRVRQFWSWGGIRADSLSELQAACEPWSVIDGDSHLSQWVKDCGCLCHDSWLLEKVIDHLTPDSVVLDLGANIGTHTRFYQDHCAKVFAWEPNPIAAACLAVNCLAVKIDQFAASNETRLAKIETAANAGASHMNFNAGGTVRCECVDDWFQNERIDFLKIDVEGCELRALIGAIQTIKRNRPKMLIEVNRGALNRHGATAVGLISCIEVFNYEIHPLSEAGEQYDILCSPK